MDNLPTTRKAYTDRKGQVWESRRGVVWLVLETVPYPEKGYVIHVTLTLYSCHANLHGWHGWKVEQLETRGLYKKAAWHETGSNLKRLE